MADAKLVMGSLISDRVKITIFPQIEKGPLPKVDAIIVHQTGSKAARSAFSSYKQGSNGAHFLIDRDGTIFQTAHVNRVCWHIGKIQSRCYKLMTCSPDEMKEIRGIMFNKADSYAARLTEVNKHEAAKSYPDRYPTNADSIGVELVAGYSEPSGYDKATDQQNASLKWLVGMLETLLGLTAADVYRHPDVSYKKPSEASSAKW